MINSDQAHQLGCSIAYPFEQPQDCRGSPSHRDQRAGHRERDEANQDRKLQPRIELTGQEQRCREDGSKLADRTCSKHVGS